MTTSLADLFQAHIARRGEKLTEALTATGLDSLVLSSGEPYTYFADDVQAPFHPSGHFRHWCPIDGPYHLLHLVPGRKPRLIRYAPEDYWYEPPELGSPFWLDAFELEEGSTPEAVWKALGTASNAAYVGNETARAKAAALAVHPPKLVARLDWDRAYKTDYELTCLDEASARGAAGHVAAKRAFHEGASELDIHYAFLEAVGVQEEELPYHTIVALDEKAAYLHYEAKRGVTNGKVLLIDAGGASRGYASDITRTHVSEDCDARFVALRDGMDAIQQSLCAAVRPGAPFTELHLLAHRKIAGLLAESGILKADPEEAVSKGWSGPFLPHGLGHHLGLQVHDVGGHLKSPDGAKEPPPAGHPYLRNTRTMEPGHVFTIEPGLYFIEMLLRPFREGSDAARFDWDRIAALSPMGGIRIEDNVAVTVEGHRNLTRAHLTA